MAYTKMTKYPNKHYTDWLSITQKIQISNFSFFEQATYCHVLPRKFAQISFKVMYMHELNVVIYT
jgi:hypothetical protein